jgi:hypothetical protein
VLDALDAIVRFAARDFNFDDVADGAILERAADRRLDGDAPIARIDLAWTDDRVVELLVKLQVPQQDFAAESNPLVRLLALDDAGRLDLPLEPIDLSLHLTHAPFGFVIRRVLTKIVILIGGREIFANGRHDVGLEVRKLSLELFQPFGGQLDDGRFFFARICSAASAAYAQTSAEIRLSHLQLGLEIRQELLEGFDACRAFARRITQVLLITFDFELGDLGNRSIRTDVANEAVDFAGRQLTLACGQTSNVLRGYLTQAFCVDLLYGNTSRGAIERPGNLGKLYGWAQHDLSCCE